MKRIVPIDIAQIKPNQSEILQNQGIPPQITPSKKILDLFDSAESIFFKFASPKGILKEISQEEFTKIYFGAGMNEPDTPLEKIFPKAHHLAIFAFTMGSAISQEIMKLLKGQHLALGYMLDAVASYCTDRAAEAAQIFFYNQILSQSPIFKTSRVLLYSPGYCGWHISGQKKLFATLQPEDIGINLNDSYLMVPLKSITGVLVAGRPEVHQFSNNFSFCTHCITQNCRKRINKMGS